MNSRVRSSVTRISSAPRQVLVVNPNTNPAVTRRVHAVASGFESQGLRLEVTNPARGPFSIETPAQRVEAERETVALISERAARGYDAYVLACFDDFALDALRALATPTESLTLGRGVLYLHAPDGIGRSALVAQLDRRLRVPLTTRNWATMLAVGELVG